MAFRFNWPEFDIEFYDEAKAQLETALNKGNKPKNIVDHITVKELHMGTQPPELEILEIGELTTDKFRGIFKLTYAGDAYIVLQTKVQANPMHAKQSALPRHTRPNILAADHPLVVPMLLRISDLKLRGIVVLVVSKTKGITLVFKNDPLENILISSTFDSVTSVRNFLQREIEKQLRNLFQEDLPVMIHNLSLRHIQSEQEKAKKQQQEARLKAQQLRKLERKKRNGNIVSPPMSVVSDPGLQRQQRQRPMSSSPSRVGSSIFPQHPSLLANFESASMPDFSPSVSSASHLYQQRQQEEERNITPSVHLSDISFPFIEDPSSFLDNARFATFYRPGSGVYSSFSDLYHNNMDQQSLSSCMKSTLPSGSSYYPSSKTPVTAANLSTLDLLYHHRQSHPPDASVAPKTIPDVFSDDDGENGFYYDDDEDDKHQHLFSPTTSSSAVATSPSIYDMYADDVDAPWYVKEGLGLPSAEESSTQQQQLILPSDQPILLDPFENAGAAKLAQLSKIHHTISPFTHTIDHVTYRSLPHAVKPTIRPKHKKIPKRRIIRLNLSGVSSD
ncbi:uncharacterized protein BX664DRAFT_350676 [Halteromyces radiatus]|uniref:uncharacterized protein n=1 Tax=Halteromyces radiatus TaxID=101107 RepID=UPI00221F0E21|nr:uncharacterized protein BX664DRAFT_350676 [Halteromyces radiatus]KAI8086263.1 hypothetical protein BX664DRAFT_350676 [Halteromyces radiatus]